MQPIYINVGIKGNLLVIPETQAHLDGHPVLTYSYYLYHNRDGRDAAYVKAKETKLLLENKTDPDFLGEIIFELPGRIFNYIPGHADQLTMDEVEQAIEQISHHRDHSSLWRS